MGKVSFIFKWGDDDIQKFERSVNEIATLQAFNRKYRLDTFKDFSYVGADCLITIDLMEFKEDFDWDKIELPDKMKAIIKDLAFYEELSSKLNAILGRLAYLSFDKRNEVELLAKQAIEIIQSFRESAYFDEPLTSKHLSLKHINHTLNKEVMILTDYVKESDSQKRKNAAYYDAVKHLTDDIQEFKRGIDNINPVDFPK